MGNQLRDTDRDWKKVAEDDPYWGVLSQDEYRKGTMDDVAFDRFMASGTTYAQDVFGLIKKHLSPAFAPDRVLDVGCGVGRLVIPFARLCKEAVGVDIAPAMLALAAKHAKQANVTNLKLVQSDDELSQAIGEFDLVNTYIVLQHIPPQRGYQLIQRMISKLKIGGVGSIQLTYAKARRFFEHEQPKAAYYRRDGDVITDIVSTDWQPPEGTINMFDYDLNQVVAIISRACGHPVLMLPTNDDSHLGVHFIFVRVK
jgi:SAM-dependent methyltransferase